MNKSEKDIFGKRLKELKWKEQETKGHRASSFGFNAVNTSLIVENVRQVAHSL